MDISKPASVLDVLTDNFKEDFHAAMTFYAEKYPENIKRAILYILSAVIFTITSALLRGIGRTDKYALYSFLSGAIKILLNVFFIAVLHWGVEGMLYASIFSQFGVALLCFVNLRVWRYIDFHTLEKNKAKDMIRYSIPLIPNKLSWAIINLSDRIIIMNRLGSNFSGLYAVANKFATLTDTLYGFFYQSWKESSARVVGENSKNEFYNSIYTYLKDFMYPLVLLMAAFMPLIFSLLVNSSYHEAIIYVPFLLIATYFSNISGFYGGIFTAYKDTKIMGMTTGASAIINLAVNLLMINRLGLYSAAISTLVANIVVYIYRKIKVRKYVRLNESRTKKWVALLVTVLITFCFYTATMPAVIFSCILSLVYAVASNLKLFKIAVKAIRR